MTNDELLQQALAAVTAKAQKLVEKSKEKVRTERKNVVADWKASQQARREAKREERLKTGREIAESFVQECADSYLRLTSVKENVEAMQGLRIVFEPGKSDQSSAPSVGILEGHKRLTTIYKATLQASRD